MSSQQNQGVSPFQESTLFTSFAKFSKPPRLEWEPVAWPPQPLHCSRSTDCPGLSWSGTKLKEAIALKVLQV